MDVRTAKLQREVLEKINDNLEKIAIALTDDHVKVYVANEPHYYQGVQSTLKVADLNKPEQPIHDN
tara:strand:+ start:60 stop:257 length:198 start_codon:yes stop_codon:yes gene_type:complete